MSIIFSLVLQVKELRPREVIHPAGALVTAASSSPNAVTWAPLSSQLPNLQPSYPAGKVLQVEVKDLQNHGDAAPQWKREAKISSS